MKRPSEIETITIKYGIIPPSGFLAITWFGNIIINKRNKEHWLNNYTEEEKQITFNHEMIHVKQAQQEHNSWLLFYIKYLYYWIKAMFLCNFKNSIAYYCIPYEIEAYTFEEDKNYNMNKTNTYKNIPMKTIVNVMKTHNGNKKDIVNYIKYMY